MRALWAAMAGLAVAPVLAAALAGQPVLAAKAALAGTIPVAPVAWMPQVTVTPPVAMPAPVAVAWARVPAPLLSRFAPEPEAGLRFPAYYGVADRAAAQVEAGQYRRALLTLRDLPESEAGRPDAGITRARAHLALGEDEAAIAALSAPLVAGTPGGQVQMIRTLLELGRTAEALQQARSHLAAHPASLPGRALLGEIHERRGEMDAARAAYGFFVSADVPGGRDFLALWRLDPGHDAFAVAEDVLAIAAALHRHATLTGTYQDNPALHSDILAMFVRVHDVIDRGNVEAHVAAAEYLLSHADDGQALTELAAALERNPRHGRALELVGRVLLRRFDFDAADKALAELRRLAPASARRKLLEARSLLQQRRGDEARGPLEELLRRQPDHLEALGLLAAVHALRLDEAGVRRTLARAAEVAPGSAIPWVELGDQLAAMRQYPRAEAAYLRAIALSPWWAEPLNSLGLLYTQWGDDDKAREVLTRARRLDPFNLRTLNYLRLLEKLDGLARVESDHFIIRFCGTRDPLLGEMMLEYMEAVREEVTGLFGHEPPVRTRIEVFPTHAQFSVRTTGTPWIGTVGASTGTVIALVAPRADPATLGTYNWAQVLRHEFAHTVTLSATENRIPHYLTEGLAVYAENAPMRWEWVPLLHMAVTRDLLFTPEELTWGFVRPRRPFDRQLAYAQSYWMSRYLMDTFGRESMLRLLAEFRNGATEAQAFVAATGLTPEGFHAAFVNWARMQVAGWGYDPASARQYEELRAEAEAAVEAGRYAEALALWKRIAALRPVDALPHQRLAGLYLTPALLDRRAAAAHLSVLHATELRDNRYARRLARLMLDEGDAAEALRFAREAVFINPYDLAAHRLLLSAAERLGDVAAVETQRRRIARLEALAPPRPGG